MDTHDHAHFDAAAATWDDDPAKVKRARAIATLLANTLPLDPTDRVLEVGGGTGSLSIALAERVGSILVTDASAGMVNVARASIAAAGLSDRLTAQQLDVANDPIPAVPFDGIWAQLALHHVHDVDALLGKLHSALDPQGWLAVVELDDDRTGAFHAKHEDFSGHHGFDRSLFADMLARNGFRDISIVDAGSIEKELHGDHAGRGTFGMFLAVGYA